MPRRTVEVRKFTLGSEPLTDDDDVQKLSPAARLSLQWEVTRNAWAFKSRNFDEPEFRRNVARLVRRGR